MGSGQVFDNLTFKHIDALRKQIQSLVDYALSHCFWTHAMLSKFCQWSQELNCFGSPVWFGPISTRGMTLDKLLLPMSSRFLHYK